MSPAFFEKSEPMCAVIRVWATSDETPRSATKQGTWLQHSITHFHILSSKLCPKPLASIIRGDVSLFSLNSSGLKLPVDTILSETCESAQSIVAGEFLALAQIVRPLWWQTRCFVTYGPYSYHMQPRIRLTRVSSIWVRMSV